MKADGPEIIHGDCIEVMLGMGDNSVDAIVTDPPYGLGFMGKHWDSLPPGKEWAEECLRVLKPGGHLLAFGGTRTWHRLAVAVEDAGFEIRDSIAWLYGSGFPKSLDVSKAIDKAAGAEREVIGVREDFAKKHAAEAARGVSNARGYNESHDPGRGGYTNPQTVGQITAPATPEAEQWQGWGTALKPAFEPVVMGRKPLVGTVAANVLEHGTGALNIDATRIGTTKDVPASASAPQAGNHVGIGSVHALSERSGMDPNTGRWPANVVLDDTTAEGFEESRFFYVAKAPKRERPVVDGVAHPTVKPLTLMRWLVKLVTPTGGTVLEPFAGSGATVEACILEGFHCIAIEREAEYLPLIQARIDRAA